MRIEMPENANRIITTLEAAGYEAYIVGGCVRDAVLGRIPGGLGYYNLGKGRSR